MDIHPPEHPIRPVRDFLLQIFTVTCGIVIASAMGQVREAYGYLASLAHIDGDLVSAYADAQKQLRRQ